MLVSNTHIYAVTFQDLFQAMWPAVKSSHSSYAHKESSGRRTGLRNIFIHIFFYLYLFVFVLSNWYCLLFKLKQKNIPHAHSFRWNANVNVYMKEMAEDDMQNFDKNAKDSWQTKYQDSLFNGQPWKDTGLCVCPWATLTWFPFPFS